MAIKTVGALRAALAKFPDDTPLALSDHDPRFGLTRPYLADRVRQTEDHMIYLKPGKKDDAARKLERKVCVLERGV